MVCIVKYTETAALCPSGYQLLGAFTLNPHASRFEQETSDHRIPIEVLYGQPLLIQLTQVLENWQPTDYASLVIIAPIRPPKCWPQSLRLIQTDNDEFSQKEGCLCCALNSEVCAALRRLFFAVLRKQEASVSQVLVVTACDTIEPMAQALKHAPFLGQRYRLLNRR